MLAPGTRASASCHASRSGAWPVCNATTVLDEYEMRMVEQSREAHAAMQAERAAADRQAAPAHS
eukprot:scaffold236870_cov18-Tisochrysis_lutea.AAC.1